MIKLSNKQASALISPVAQMLFSDNRRPFPIRDAFLLLDLTKNIEQRIKPYRDKFSDIVNESDGVILPDGSIKIEDEEKRFEAKKMLSELNDIELEYPGEQLKITDEWPKLSVQEASILQPLISKE